MHIRALIAPSSVRVWNCCSVEKMLLLTSRARHQITPQLVHQMNASNNRRRSSFRDVPGALALLWLAGVLQRFQQTLDPLTGRLPPPFLATFDPRNPRGQEKGSESPR